MKPSNILYGAHCVGKKWKNDWGDQPQKDSKFGAEYNLSLHSNLLKIWMKKLKFAPKSLNPCQTKSGR